MANTETFPHQDKNFFRTAIEDTRASTYFSSRLIEKDYYCSLILRSLYASADSQVIFKGGTALNKVHMGFYRLSEDLDFAVSISPTASRNERSKQAKPFKQLVEKIAASIPGLALKDPLKGANNSSQYQSTFEYPSLFTAESGTILFELALREKVLEQPIQRNANTLASDQFGGNTLVPPFLVTCLTREESYAEKLRAALSREEPAVRDLFDVDYAVRSNKLAIDDLKFNEMVKTKLTVPTKRTIDLSEERKQALKQQLTAQLEPVLRPNDFNTFNFEAAWQFLYAIGFSYLRGA